MFEKLSLVENRYEQIGVELTRPEVASDNSLFTKLMKEHSELTPIVEKYREYCAAVKAEKEALEMLEAGKTPKEIIPDKTSAKCIDTNTSPKKVDRGKVMAFIMPDGVLARLRMRWDVRRRECIRS